MAMRIRLTQLRDVFATPATRVTHHATGLDGRVTPYIIQPPEVAGLLAFRPQQACDLLWEA